MMPLCSSNDSRPTVTKRSSGDTESAPRRKAAIQRGFDIAPIGHVLGEDGLKACVVRRLDQVSEFVQHQIFDGAWRVLDELEVEHDVAGARAACPPLAFHGADANLGGFHAEALLPLRHQHVQALLQFPAVRPVDVALDFRGIAGIAGVHHEARFLGRFRRAFGLEIALRSD